MKLDITSTPLSIAPPSAPSVPFAATPVGIASNTVKGLLGNVPLRDNPWLKVAADIGQGIARTVGSIGLTSMNTTLKLIAPQLVQQNIQVPHYLTPIFGDGTELKDIPKRVADASEKIKQNTFAQSLGLDKHAAPLALGSIIGQSALDLSGLGGEKGAYSALAKETNPSLITGMLRKMGLSDLVAERLAPHIASVSREKDVRNILDIAKSMHGLEIMTDAEKAQAGASEASPGSSQFPDTPPFPSEKKPVSIESAPAAGQPIRPTTAEAAATRFYKEKIAPEVAAGKPVVVGADDLKYHFGNDFDIANHPMYSKAANDILMKAAEDSPKPKVIFTAGGTGSGKSELIRSSLANDAGKDVAAIYDSTLTNLEGARGQIKALQAMGKTVEVHAILRDPETAFSFTQKREAAGGHPVSDTAFARSHAGVPVVLRDLIEKDGVPVKLLDVRGFNSPEQYKNLQYTKDPLATLKETRYNEDDVKQIIANERAKSGAEAGSVSSRSEAGKNPQEKSDQAGTGGPVLRSEESAKAFEESLKAVPKTARAPALELARLDAGKDGKSWSTLVKGYTNTLSREEKVHFLDLFATPEFVLEKIGLAKGAEKLQEAKDLAQSNLKKEIETIKGWRARVGKDPYASMRIFRYLDGQAKEVFHEMTAEEKVVAKEMKAYLKDWADRLKLPEDNRISNYITHIFDDASIEGKESVFEQDPELAAIMQDKVAGSVYDPFTQKRLGKKGYREDVWAALDAYVKRGTRKEAMDPALEYLKNQAKTLDDSSYKYVRNLTHRINMRPTEMDVYLDNLIKKTPLLKRLAKGPRPTMFLTQKIRQIFYRGTLGLNFGSALRNISQGANTYAKLGEKYTVIGYTKTLARLLTNNFDELKRVGVLSEELNQDRKVGVYKTFLQKADPVLFGMFEVAEKINRGAAYFGAKSKALKKGLTEEEAIKYAKRMVRETQFAFGNVDSPAILASDIAKTAGQLGTYNLKQIEFLGRMAKNKEYAGLIRYTFASLAFVATVGKMFGMTIDQLVPSVGLGGSPVGNLLTGIGELMSTNSQTQAAGKNKISRAAVSMIPGGAQIKKTVQGITAYNKGKDTTATGKTRFKIPKGTGSFLQNALFGKSSTPEAQKYYKELGKKKKKSGGGLTI